MNRLTKNRILALSAAYVAGSYAYSIVFMLYHTGSSLSLDRIIIVVLSPVWFSIHMPLVLLCTVYGGHGGWGTANTVSTIGFIAVAIMMYFTSRMFQDNKLSKALQTLPPDPVGHSGVERGPLCHNIMKRIVIIAAWILTAYAAFRVGRFVEGFRFDLNPETAYSDYEVRQHIAQAGVSIPEGSSDLFCLEVGFEEPETYIHMSVPKDTITNIASSWLRVPLELASRMPPEKYCRCDPAFSRKTNAALLQCSLSGFNKPIGWEYTTNRFQSLRAVVYEENGTRLMLYEWIE